MTLKPIWYTINVIIPTHALGDVTYMSGDISFPEKIFSVRTLLFYCIPKKY